MGTEIETRLSRKIAKAVLTFGMIDPHDRILVAASGGKDSTSLLYHLAVKRKNFSIPFDFTALHVHTEYCTCTDHPEIWERIHDWGIDVRTIEFSITDRLKQGKRMNCYWCATQRRTELLKYAEVEGYQKIALGHHQDDILETYFMNMIYKGELSSMLPVMDYDKYPQRIIRPLALVKESEIIEFANELGISQISCSCNFDTRSKRRDVRKHIESICDGKPYLKNNIFRSMANPILRYLLVDERAPREGLQRTTVQPHSVMPVISGIIHRSQEGSMQKDELIAIQKKFDQGVQKLDLLEACLDSVTKSAGIAVIADAVDRRNGEIKFTFAGMSFFIRVRVTDRDVDDVGDVGTEYRVPVGWLDWGLVGENGSPEKPIMSNFYDERGILCELEKEEFYCDFSNCDDDRVRRGMLMKLGKLVGRSISRNNAL